jgi:hypothetical protein
VETLRGPWDAWTAARVAAEDARKAYYAAANTGAIQICSHCCKPMPGGDSSSTCDGCHLPWGWSTPQGRRDRRANELDAQIEALRKEREALK